MRYEHEAGAMGGFAIATSIFLIFLCLYWVVIDWKEVAVIVTFIVPGFYMVVTAVVWIAEYRKRTTYWRKENNA